MTAAAYRHIDIESGGYTDENSCRIVTAFVEEFHYESASCARDNRRE